MNRNFLWKNNVTRKGSHFYPGIFLMSEYFIQTALNQHHISI